MDIVINYGFSVLILLLSFSTVEIFLVRILGEKLTTILIKTIFTIAMVIIGYAIIDSILFSLYLYNTLFDNIVGSIVVYGLLGLGLFFSFAIVFTYHFSNNELGIPKVIAIIISVPVFISVMLITNMMQEISATEYKNINIIYQKVQKNKTLKKLFSEKYTDFSKDTFISRREYRVLKKIGDYFDYIQKQNIDNQIKIKNEALKKSYIRDLKQKI